MSTPRVSVVIPAHNRASYLPAAIDSVLAQDYADIELIVIDDGSTDGTSDVLRSYGDRVRWESQANAGQSAALNKGWSMATGEILAYLGDDDYYLPGLVTRSVDVLQANPPVVLTYCDYDLVSPDSRLLRHVRTAEFDYVRLVAEFVVPPGPGFFFRRSAFERTGGWDTSLRQMPDYDFWLRLGLEGEFRRIPEILAAFRVHEGSLSFSRGDEERAEEPVRILERYFEQKSLPLRFSALRAKSLSLANVVAARAHLRSGRYVSALRSIASAWKLSARTVLTPRSTRFILSGLFGRPIHIATWRMARAHEAK